MKFSKVLLVFIFSVCCFYNLFCQELLTKGAIWTYSYGPSMSGRIGVVKLTYERDTVIQARSCKIISGRNTFAFIGTPSDTSSFTFRYFLNEENDTLSFYDIGERSFFTLYNFAGQVGDSWQWPNLDCPTEVTIDSIGSRVINGDTLRTIYIFIDHEWYPSKRVLIEKVGPESGYFLLFHGLVCGTDRFSLGNLICYEDSVLGLYQVDPEIPCYYRFVSIDEASRINIRIYPNPVHNSWFIQSKKEAIVQLYDLSGKQVLQKQIQVGVNQVDVSSFNTGVYFYSFLNEDRSVIKSGKVVKSN